MNSIYRRVRHQWWFFFVVLIVVVSFAVGTSERIQLLPTVEFHWSDQASEYRYSPSHENASVKEIVMVYIGSSTCDYSNDSSLPRLIDDVKINLQSSAIKQGWSFRAIGVSIDWIPEDGIDHLDKFGDFDEIITGRKWEGTGAYLYTKKMPGINGTPQILVLGRQIGEDSVSTELEEMLIYRVAGLYRIQNWVNQDFPLPQDVLERFSNEFYCKDCG